ncbi:hypothetical protein LCGC14_1853340 [marine sediment metagenome]|uniref:Uncharacterized protein n=1 Tax=marine sediment metagenome TaxID=412755 RepID=A0A0F9GA28_9ZZZZ
MEINVSEMECRVKHSIKFLPQLIKETDEELQMLRDALKVLKSGDERYLDDLKVLYDKSFGKLVDLHTPFAKNTSDIETLLGDIGGAVKNRWPED